MKCWTWPSIVFARIHEVGVTALRSQQIAEPRPGKRTLGYDANVLYLPTILREIPCGKKRFVQHSDSVQAARQIRQRLKNRTMFRLAEVDLKFPKPLWPKFEEMCPFFNSKAVLVEAVPREILDHLQSTSRKCGDGKKLVGLVRREAVGV